METNNVTFDFKNVHKIATNIIAWDYILGGGIDPTSTIQLVGESSSGKTMLSIQLAAILCKQNKKVIYLDTESNVSFETLEKMHLNDNDNFNYVRESNFDEAEKKLDLLLKKYDDLSMIIVDSISGLINPCYLDLTDKKKGTTKISNYNTNFESRPLGLFIKKYKALCSKRNITFFMVNQYRNKIHKKLGTILKRSGPKIVDYSSNIIIKINDDVADKDFKTPSLNIGSKHELEIVKSNVLKPKTKIPYYMEYDGGISNIYNIIHCWIKNKIIVQNGAYYEIPQLNLKVNGITKLKLELSTKLQNASIDSNIYTFYDSQQ